MREIRRKNSRKKGERRKKTKNLPAPATPDDVPPALTHSGCARATVVWKLFSFVELFVGTFKTEKNKKEKKKEVMWVTHASLHSSLRLRWRVLFRWRLGSCGVLFKTKPSSANTNNRAPSTKSPSTIIS